MAFADFQEKQKQNKQKAVLRDFFVKRHGLLLVLSDDPIFVRLLRTTVKELALGNEASLVNLVLDPTKTLKAITDAFNDNRRPALFIERVMTSTGDTSLLIKQYKESFPELRIFVMTTTADKGRIMLMFEAGADNFILKPISGIDLVEKMSATLREPSLVQQLLDKARGFVLRNFGGEAIKITKKILEAKPDNAAGYVVMGDALRVSGNSEQARMAYEKASKFNDNYLEPLQKLVDLAKETGKQDMQLKYLKRLDELSPLNAQRKVELGQLQAAMGNTEAAKQLFDTAISRAYKDAMSQVAAMTEQIAMTLQDSDPVQAEKYLRQCLEIKGQNLSADDLSTFNQLGISLRKQGRWKDAITEYKKALKIVPNSAVLFYNIALAHAEGKENDLAVNSMLKALSLDGALPRSSPVIALNMGKVFSRGYTLDKALKCLEIALELQPGNAEAQRLLSDITAKLAKEKEEEQAGLGGSRSSLAAELAQRHAGAPVGVRRR